MSTKDEVKPQEEAENAEQAQPEEEVEEEEPVDVELQKQMKNLKFDDSAFTKKTDTKKKEKKEEKKSKKNKGQDFLDYASKNNIQINIEYEEDKIQEKRKQFNEKNKKFNGTKQGGRYQRKPGQNDGYTGNKYNNRNQGYRQQKRPPFKFGGNKFDACNMQKTPYEMQYQENVYVQKQTPILTEDKDILAFVEDMFTSTSLNKDIYLRKHLSENGEIDINDIVNYYTIKNNNLSAEKISQVLKDSKSLEIKKENDKTFVVVKGFKEMSLLSLETIAASKKAAKMQRMQQNMYPPMGEYAPYMGGYNYIHMQNNYFIPSQGFYPMSGMYQYQPQQGTEEQK